MAARIKSRNSRSHSTLVKLYQQKFDFTWQLDRSNSTVKLDLAATDQPTGGIVDIVDGSNFLYSYVEPIVSWHLTRPLKTGNLELGFLWFVKAFLAVTPHISIYRKFFVLLSPAILGFFFRVLRKKALFAWKSLSWKKKSNWFVNPYPHDFHFAVVVAVVAASYLLAVQKGAMPPLLDGWRWRWQPQVLCWQSKRDCTGIFWSGSCVFLGLILNSPDASDIVCCVLSPGSLCHRGQLQPSWMGNLMAVDAV